MAEEKQVAKQEKPGTLKGWLQSEEFKAQVQAALPKQISSDRFMRMALTALTRQPKLAECTQKSVFQCLLDLGSLGIEPDGRRAHLIPFWDKHQKGYVCTLIVDYKGIVELVRRSGEVQDIQADVVRENDTFDFRKGKDGYLTHSWKLGQDRGEPIGAYSYVVPYEGKETFDVMDVPQIEAVRKRSKSSDSGPWVTDWAEMAKKTVFRRHSKWLPLSPETREAIEKDDDQVIDTTPAKPAVKAPSFLEQPKEVSEGFPGAAKSATETTEEEPGVEPKDAKSHLYNAMERDGITEADLLIWGQATAKIDDSIGSLEELATVDSAKVERLVDEWDSIANQIKGRGE